MYGNARADSSENRLFHDISILCSSSNCCFYNRASLCRSNSRRNRDHDFRLKNIPFAESFVDEVAQHGFRHAIVGDHSVLHRTIRDDAVRSPADHFLCFCSNSKDFFVLLGNGHDRRLIENDSFFWNEDEGVGGAEIYSDFLVEERHGYVGSLYA